jgi:outer membrane immunogenic protein
MKRLLLSMTAIVSLVAATEGAVAADIARRPAPAPVAVKAPPLPIFDWSGFYVGVHGGYAWGSTSIDYAGFPSASTDANGWLLGGLIGVNYQVGQTVFGVEADLNWSDLKSGTTCAAVAGPCEVNNSWLGTARGRLGYAMDRFMPYVTGGVAFGDVEANVPGIGRASDTRVGWTVGVGAEYAFSPNMSWKTEYLFVDLGKFDCGLACGVGSPTNVKFDAHIVRTGLNFRF